MQKRTYAGCTADLSEKLQLLLLHNTGKTEVSDHDVRVLVFCAEQEVLWLKI